MGEEKKALSVLLMDLKGADFSHIKQGFLEDLSYPAQFDAASSVSGALEKLKENRYHVVLSRLFPPDRSEDFKRLLAELNDKNLRTPFLLILKPGEEETGRKAVQFGATDFFVETEEGLRDLPRRLWSAYHTKLAETGEKLLKFSLRDELTGIYNHRFFQERLMEEYGRAVRYGHPLSCLLVDLDHFRKVNETLGHGAGDRVLKEAALLLVQSCRLSDLIGRFGGEEFSVLLPHIDYAGANELAERLRAVFAEHTFLADTHRISLTVSIGVSSFPGDLIKQRSDLLNFADQALFRAKAGGRNRVLFYRDIIPTMGETFPNLKISEERILEFQKKLATLADQARRGYIEATKALMQALESKDHLTAGHAGTTAKLSRQVAEAMGLPLDEAETVEHAGLLHDIGKISISDEVLLKPGRFSLGEYEAMKQHPYFGYRIVKPIKFLREEATLILHHHEWFNGEGYPCRLRGKEIPLGSRIIAVVDSYDTMREAGSRYKGVMTAEETVNELIRCAGTQFDPEVVQAFIQVLLMRKELKSDAFDKNILRGALEAQSQNQVNKI